MAFDQFANQGDTAAWDPEAAAATKKAADKIFNPPLDTDKTVGTDGDEDAPKKDPNPDDPDQPGEGPDPDITLDP